MYAVSNAFRTALQNAARTDKIAGTITLTNGTAIDFTDADIKSGTVTIDNQCVNGDELEFGAVFAAQAGFTLKTDIDRYKLFDAQIDLVYSLQLADGTFEPVPLGVYYVTEPVRKGESVQLTALDGMIKFNTSYDGTTMYGTPFELLERVCAAAGVPLVNEQAEIDAMCNGAMIVQLDGNSGCSTLRDCIAEIARLLGAFATMYRNAGLKIVQFGGDSVQTITANQRFSTEVSDFVTDYIGIQFNQQAGVLESYDKDKQSGLVMECDGIPFLDYGMEDTKQQAVDNIRAVLCGLQYTPVSISFTGNPALDLGDTVTIPVDENTVVTSLITSFAWKYRAKESIKCVGKNPYLTNVKDSNSRKLSNIESQIESEVTSVVAFENIREHKVTTKLEQLIKMYFVATKKTSAVFSGTILLDVNTDEQETVYKTTYQLTTDPATGAVSLQEVQTPETVTVAKEKTITFQYCLNNVFNELHLPVQTIKTGRYIVTITYPILDIEKNTVNDFRVYAMIDGGNVTVPAFGAKASISGSGMKADEKVWDGTITIEEILPSVALNTAMDVFPMAAVLTMQQQKPKSSVVSVSMPVVSLGGCMTVGGMAESFEFGEITTREVISKEKIAGYTFNNRYVTAESGAFMLVGDWVYTSAEQTVESGRMTALNIVDDDLTVAGIEVVKNG